MFMHLILSEVFCFIGGLHLQWWWTQSTAKRYM